MRVGKLETFDLSGEIVALLGAADTGIEDNGGIDRSPQVGVHVEQTLPGRIADGGNDSVVGIAAECVGMQSKFGNGLTERDVGHVLSESL